MLLLFLAAAGSPAADRTLPVEPATVTVRIVRAAEIRGDRLEPLEGSVKRTARVRESDGTLRTASLVEFY